MYLGANKLIIEQPLRNHVKVVMRTPEGLEEIGLYPKVALDKFRTPESNKNFIDSTEKMKII